MESNTATKSVSQIITGILIFSLAGIVKSIFMSLAFVGDVAIAMSGGVSSTTTIVNWVFSLIVIGGYVLMILGLGGFMNTLDEKGKKAVNLVRIGVILALAANLPFLPAMLIGLMALAAFILELVGYIQLKGSDSLNEMGKSGAQLIVISMIIAIVGGLFTWIPFLGWIFSVVFSLITFILLLMGWSKIKKAVA